VDQFSKFFHQVICKKIIYVTLQRFQPHLQYVATLPCEIQKSKKYYWLWHHLNRVLTYSCEHFENLIKHLTVVRQTVSRLLTLTDWLTFWSLSDDVSDEQLNLIQLNIVASWRFFHHDYLHTVFVLSRLYFIYCTHIEVKSLVRYAYGMLHNISH